MLFVTEEEDEENYESAKKQLPKKSTKSIKNRSNSPPLNETANIETFNRLFDDSKQNEEKRIKK
jgi:hypothetical protein